MSATALAITQQAIAALSKWVNYPLPFTAIPDTAATTTAKTLLGYPDFQPLGPLRVLFDQIHLQQGQTQSHYWPLEAIADGFPSIPYPLSQSPSPTTFQALLQSILAQITESDWQNSAVLGLILEKYGSYLSCGEEDIALIDLVRSLTAIAEVLTPNPEASHLSLIAGDLSGIQNFIYTIAADGALKSLRARSFYLELVTEEIVTQLLELFNLPRANIIYAGGGNLYILTACDEANQTKLTEFRNNLNNWLLKTFQGKVYLTLDNLDFPVTDLKTAAFAQHWTTVTKNLAKQKAQKFSVQIQQLLSPQKSHEPCKVCHRDDTDNLEPLNPQELDSVLACGTCRRMYRLGGQLFKVKAIIRSEKENLRGALDRLKLQNIYYHLFEDIPLANEGDNLYLVNNWCVDNYRTPTAIPLLLGNYGNKNEIGFLSAAEMADNAQGIPRVGYLRMDVDRLGQIFAKGLGARQTFPRLAGLSRQMSYFFKVYLNSLAADRFKNLPSTQCLSSNNYQNLLFIYAGGDDLFVSGSWNEICEFSLDIYQAFRLYTGEHPDITLSAGISIENAKFPLYQGAHNSGEAEEKAKGNGRDSLSLFGEVFKWDEWLGKNINPEIIDYIGETEKPPLLGVLPLVEILNQQLTANYSRSFIRNLLTTASLQEKMLKNAKTEEKQDIRYYLHLPKVAYTISRLPPKVRDGTEFKKLSSSMKHPYNAPYFRAIATWIEYLNRGN